MSFTDDDLRKLRSVLKQLNGFEIHGGFTVKEFEALLARLEAAENVIKHVSRKPSDVNDHYTEAWRKTAGKDAK